MLLEAYSIYRSFHVGEREITALNPVSTAVEQGDFLVITGPSGSGKSTLLNILSGLDRPRAGDVLFKNRSLLAMNERDLSKLRNTSFGFIFQSPHLLPDKTLFENVALPFRYGPYVDPITVRTRCRTLLDYVGLVSLADRYPNTLSGGEMQRVVFARALVREPEVIFADEPTGSLDGQNSRRLLELLREQTAEGRTVIMATHDSAAMEYGSARLHLDKFTQETFDE